MSTSIQNQNFGVEIELTGITRATAAATIAEYFGKTSRHIGTSYDTYGARDRKGRTWKAMRDGSIRCEKKRGDEIVPADQRYSCEVVTPILQYEDIEDLQNVVRALVKKGLFKRVRIGTAIRISGRSFGRVTGAIVIQRSAPWRGCGALLCMIARLFI